MLKVPYDRLVVRGYPPVLQIPGYPPNIVQAIAYALSQVISSPKTPVGIYTANLVSIGDYNNQEYRDLVQLALLWLPMVGNDVEKAARKAFSELSALVLVSTPELVDIVDNTVVNKAMSHMNDLVDLFLRIQVPPNLSFSRWFIDTLTKYAEIEKKTVLSIGQQQPLSPSFPPMGASGYPPQQLGGYPPPISGYPPQPTYTHQYSHVNLATRPTTPSTTAGGNKIFTGRDDTSTETSLPVMSKTEEKPKDEEVWLPDHSPTTRPLNMVYAKAVIRNKNGVKYWSIEMDENAHRLFEDKLERNMEVVIRSNSNGAPNPIVNHIEKTLHIRDHYDVIPIATDRSMYLKDTVIVDRIDMVQIVPFIINRRKVDDRIVNLTERYDTIIDLIDAIRSTASLNNPHNVTIVEKTLGNVVKRYVHGSCHELIVIDNIVNDLSEQALSLLTNEVPYDMVSKLRTYLNTLWTRIRQVTPDILRQCPDWVNEMADIMENEMGIIAIPKTYCLLDLVNYGIAVDDIVTMSPKDKSSTRFVVDKDINPKFYELLVELVEGDDPVYLVDTSTCGLVTMKITKDMVSGDLILVYSE